MSFALISVYKTALFDTRPADHHSITITGILDLVLTENALLRSGVPLAFPPSLRPLLRSGFGVR